MSKIFDKAMGSFSERSATATITSLLIAFGWYGVVTGSNAGSATFRNTDYKPLLAVAVVLFAFLMSATHAILAALSPAAASQFDERDQAIERSARRLGGVVLATGGFGAIVLAVSEASHFSITQMLVGAWVLSELASNTFAVAMHRRGR